MVVIHKIIEWLELEVGFEGHLVPTPKVSFVSSSGLSCSSVKCISV